MTTYATPRNTRPSWVNVYTDGRRNDIATGPRARNGSMQIELAVREGGRVLDLLDIQANASEDGSTVTVEIKDQRTGAVIYSETFKQ